MVSGTKFYIFGGGRWREIDINDGRVDGWGRSRFVYPKRGKVRVAKTGAVLAGLKDLVAGKRSTVKDGAHLPYKKLNPIIKNKPTLSVEVQCLPKSDICIQTSLPSQTLTFPQNFNERKRPRPPSTSSGEMPSKITTTALVHTSNAKKVHKKQKINISSDEDTVVTTKGKIPSLKLNKADSAKYNIYQRKRSNSSDSVVWVVLPKKKVNDNENDSNETNLNSKQLANKNDSKLTSNKQINRNSSGAMQKVATTADDQDIVNCKPDSKVVKQRQDQCNELYIDEEDVEIFRRYLIKHAKNFDLIKFDEDDEYKKHFFFKINPLVNLERCQKIAKMLRKDSQSRISLNDFVNQLGLRSVSEPSETKRYKMRKKTQPEKANNLNSDETDRENVKSHRETKKIYKSDKKQTNKQNKFKISSSDYDTDTESSEEHDTRLNRKFERLNAISDEYSKKYRTRRSNMNISRKTQRSKLKRGKKTELSTEEESTRPITRSKRRTGENVTLDLTLTSDDEKDNAAVRKSNRKRNNSIEITDSSDTEVKTKKLSKKLEKRLYNKNDANKRGENETQNSTDGGNSFAEVDVKSKIRKRNKSNDESTDLERAKDKYQHRTKRLKYFNKSGDENSGSEIQNSKETKNKNRNQNDVAKIKANRNRKSEKESISESSDVEMEIKNNKRKYKKIKDKVVSDTDEESSKIFKTNKRDQNKENSNKFKKGDNLNSTTNLVEKPLKETQKKIDNGMKSDIDTDDEITSNKRKEIKKQPSKVQVKNGVKMQEFEAKSVENDKIKTNEVGKLAASVNSRQTRHSISRRPTSSRLQLREYSNLEDHAIVSFVSTGGRAQCVNGNRIWVELQDRYYAITGQTRTWHSLRNRYLRYILPKLGSLALPPTEEKRLRAAAATGEIKRKRIERRNSIFGAPSRGALSRRPRSTRSSSEERPIPPKRHKHDRSRKVTPPPSTKRALRSSLPPAPTSPRYSDITRQFAAKHRQNESTPNSSPKPETKDTKSSNKDALDSADEFSKKERIKKKKVGSDKVIALGSESEFSEKEQNSSSRNSKKKIKSTIIELTGLDSEIEFSESEQRSGRKKKEVGRKKLTELNSEAEFSEREQRKIRRRKESTELKDKEFSEKEQKTGIKDKLASDKSIALDDSEGDYPKKEIRRSMRRKASSALESGDEISEQDQKSRNRREIVNKKLTDLTKEKEFSKKERKTGIKDKVAIDKSIALDDSESDFSKKEIRRSRRRKELRAIERDDEMSEQEQRSNKRSRGIVSKELTALESDRESQKEERRIRTAKKGASEKSIILDSERENSKMEQRRSRRDKGVADAELTTLERVSDIVKDQSTSKKNKIGRKEFNALMKDIEILKKEQSIFTDLDDSESQLQKKERRMTRRREIASGESTVSESDSEHLKEERKRNKDETSVQESRTKVLRKLFRNADRKRSIEIEREKTKTRKLFNPNTLL